MRIATNRGWTGFPPAVLLFLPLLLLLLAPPRRAEAEILGLSQLDLDFTKADEVKAKVRWGDTDLFRLTDRGLGRSKEPAGGRRVTLWTIDPLALGTWWRPTDNAQVSARIRWAGEHAAAMRGDLFVSASCDAHRWSEWRHVRETTEGTKNAARVHETTLRVPRSTRTWYHRQLREYAEQDVPWSSDEEAFVTWYRERHPRAFEERRPFLGYLRFMYEAEIPHGTFIEGIEIDVTWVVSGISSIPKDKSVEANQERRRDEPWNWNADARHLDPQDFDRAAATRGVYQVVLKRMLTQEKQDKGGDTEPMERILLLADTGTMRSSIRDELEFLDRTLGKDGAKIETRRALEPKGVAEAHLAAFQGVYRLSGWVPAELDIGAPIVQVPAAWLHEFMEEGRPTGWHAIRRRFGNTRGYTQLSEVVFDAKRTRALVTIGRYVGFLYGMGETILLELRDGAWTIVSTSVAWVS